jgi:hypothetical protein
MIVDTSALIAILRDGPATAACVHAIEDSADPPALHSNFSPIAVCGSSRMITGDFRLYPAGACNIQRSYLWTQVLLRISPPPAVGKKKELECHRSLRR